MDGFIRSTKYIIKLNDEASEVNCSYQLFVFKEILYRYAIYVLIFHDKNHKI